MVFDGSEDGRDVEYRVLRDNLPIQIEVEASIVCEAREVEMNETFGICFKENLKYFIQFLCVFLELFLLFYVFHSLI